MGFYQLCLTVLLLLASLLLDFLPPQNSRFDKIIILPFFVFSTLGNLFSPFFYASKIIIPFFYN